MSKYELYINLAIEACDKLERTNIAQLQNETVWDATLMRFQVLGENIKKIPPSFKKKFPTIKWKNFEWFRDQISHEYKTVFKEVVRDIIQKDLSNLKKVLLEIKEEIKKSAQESPQLKSKILK